MVVGDTESGIVDVNSLSADGLAQKHAAASNAELTGTHHAVETQSEACALIDEAKAGKEGDIYAPRRRVAISLQGMCARQSPCARAGFVAHGIDLRGQFASASTVSYSSAFTASAILAELGPISA